MLNHNCGKGHYAKEENEMLYFFGVLIGFGILSTNPLFLSLSLTFWKQVVSTEELTNESDLYLQDQYSWQMLQGIRKAAKSVTDEEFEETCGQKFVMNVSGTPNEDEQEIELCTDGRRRQLTRKNAEEFIKLTVRMLLNRSSVQMAKVREGIEFVCGNKIPYVLSWRYAEERCVGKQTTDIEYLKRHTKYESHLSSKDSKCRKWFWEIMEEMAEEDRQLYLRFVNGQGKLPINLASLDYQHTL